mmetsp:Transcript_53361/g.119767  ORF Transcript_53361/g.119767 Transcript_53361/m.119767 type:complete len:339 (-) Transcript_53361:525-1541(-)
MALFPSPTIPPSHSDPSCPNHTHSIPIHARSWGDKMMKNLGLDEASRLEQKRKADASAAAAAAAAERARAEVPPWAMQQQAYLQHTQVQQQVGTPPIAPTGGNQSYRWDGSTGYLGGAYGGSPAQAQAPTEGAPGGGPPGFTPPSQSGSPSTFSSSTGGGYSSQFRGAQGQQWGGSGPDTGSAGQQQWGGSPVSPTPQHTFDGSAQPPTSGVSPPGGQPYANPAAPLGTTQWGSPPPESQWGPPAGGQVGAPPNVAQQSWGAQPSQTLSQQPSQPPYQEQSYVNGPQQHSLQPQSYPTAPHQVVGEGAEVPVPPQLEGDGMPTSQEGGSEGDAQEAPR